MDPREQGAVPENYRPKYPFRKAMGCPWGLRDERLAPMPRTKLAVETHRQEYYAITTHTDRQIGRILRALRKSGEAENTYIFFTADHGLAVGHHGLFGKQNLFEHSMRVPFIVRGPDVPKDKRIRSRIYLQDVMPSTLGIAGVEPPDPVQFKPVQPLIRGEVDRTHDAIYGGYLDRQRAVIDGKYKLILNPKIEKVLLFNLVEEPQEMNNLADDPEHTGVVRRLFEKLLELQEPTGDRLDRESAYPELAKGVAGWRSGRERITR